MADWGWLTPAYNLGAAVGGYISGLGAQAGAAISPYIPQAPAPAPAPSQSANPVTAATQYYNQNFNVTTPGSTPVPFSSGGNASFIAPTPIASTPAQDLQGQIGGIGKGIADIGVGTFGAIAGAGAAVGAMAFNAGISASPFSQQPAAPTPISNMIDAPRGIIPLEPFAQQKAQPTIFYVPEGSYKQIGIENAKMVYGPTAGDVGFYQTPKSIYEDSGFTRKYGFVSSSGGPGALQSGMFSLEPLTPAVYTQESGGKVLAPGANPLAAGEVLRSPEKYSRLGAEAYGGFVQPLDNRTLQPGTEMSRYAEGGNLANLVNPFGTNEPKSSWETIPWGIETKGAPAIQNIDVQGRLSSPMNIAKEEIAAAPAPQLQDAGALGLPTPFRSVQTNPSGLPSFNPFKGAVVGSVGFGAGAANVVEDIFGANAANPELWATIAANPESWGVVGGLGAAYLLESSGRLGFFGETKETSVRSLGAGTASFLYNEGYAFEGRLREGSYKAPEPAVMSFEPVNPLEARVQSVYGNAVERQNVALPTPFRAVTGTPQMSISGEYPAKTPNIFPSEYPYKSPTVYKEDYPARNPVIFPSEYPYKNPIVTADEYPYRGEMPVQNPTKNPVIFPDEFPSEYPTQNPTKNPYINPDENPVIFPDEFPNKNPVINPTQNPTTNPFQTPFNTPVQNPFNTNNPNPDVPNPPKVDLKLGPGIIPPFGFGGGGGGGSGFRGRRGVFTESFKVGTGIKFGELGIGRKGKGRKLKL